MGWAEKRISSYAGWMGLGQLERLQPKPHFQFVPGIYIVSENPKAEIPTRPAGLGVYKLAAKSESERYTPAQFIVMGKLNSVSVQISFFSYHCSFLSF